MRGSRLTNGVSPALATVKALLRKFNESGTQSQFARLVTLIMMTARIMDTTSRYKVTNNRLLGCMRNLLFCILTI